MLLPSQKIEPPMGKKAYDWEEHEIAMYGGSVPRLSQYMTGAAAQRMALREVFRHRELVRQGKLSPWTLVRSTLLIKFGPVLPEEKQFKGFLISVSDTQFRRTDFPRQYRGPRWLEETSAEGQRRMRASVPRGSDLYEIEKMMSDDEMAIAVRLIVEETADVWAVKENNVEPVPDARVALPGQNLNGDPSTLLRYEFKTLNPGATADTVINRINASLKNQGQGPYIIFNAEESDLAPESAVAAVDELTLQILNYKPRYFSRVSHIRIMGKDYDYLWVFQNPIQSPDEMEKEKVPVYFSTER